MKSPRQRQLAYRLLGSLCLYPNHERIGTLRAAAEEMQQDHHWWSDSAFADSWRPLWETLSQLQESPSIAIEEEYTRLFLANAFAPPYESFYLDQQGHVRGVIAVQLEREYASAGLAPSPSLKEPTDHIAVELEFMSYLCDLEAQALESEDLDTANEVSQRQSRFLSTHLGRWVPAFARQVQKGEAGRLYGKVANAIDAFVRLDLTTPASLSSH
ncbi:MAG: hypothetical protein BMS9Abin28_0098 [Anaerolineae bacterium]|nr:MAG: hypothetical protein BMS9Abin28_0098 [Anaerolineae bacterium]